MMTYTFPELDNKEIVQCLNGLQIPLSEEKLARATIRDVKPIYERFVQYFMGISKDDQLHFNIQEVFEFPGLHEQSLGEVRVLSAMRKLMIAAGINDFSFQDMLHPSPKRTSKIISALINFAKFREECMIIYQKYQNETDKLIEEKRQREEEHDELSAKLQEMITRQKFEEPDVERVKKEMEPVIKEVRELHQRYETLKQDIQHIKEENQEFIDKLAAINLATVNCRQDCDRLKNNIVRSPERLKKTLKDMSNTAEVEKEATETTKNRFRGLQSKNDILGKALHKLNKRIKEMENIEQQMTSFKSISHEIKETQTNINKTEQDLKSILETDRHLHEQIKNTQEKLRRLEHQFARKRAATGDALLHAEGEKRALEREQAANIFQLEKTKLSIDERLKEIAELRTSHENDISQARKAYSRLIEQVKLHQSSMKQIMQTVNRQTPRRQTPRRTPIKILN